MSKTLSALTEATTVATSDIFAMVVSGNSRKATLATAFKAFNLHPGTNILEQRNGANPQAFRLYNTYTDASNYERGFMRWVSNNLEIGAEGAGTGSNTRSTRILAAGAVVAEVQQSYFGLYGGGARNILINTGVAPQINLVAAGRYGWGAADTADTHFARSAAGVIGFRAAIGVGGAAEFIEQTAPSAPATNGVRIYAEDDGAGKTRLMALFATGAAQQIAIEP